MFLTNDVHQCHMCIMIQILLWTPHSLNLHCSEEFISSSKCNFISLDASVWTCSTYLFAQIIRFRIYGLGFWVLRFRVWGLWFRVWGLGFRVCGLGFRVFCVRLRVKLQKPLRDCYIPK